MKWFALYAAFAEKLDPRDWMTGDALDFDEPADDTPGEFWFDFLADTGDGEAAVYSLAALCMQDLAAQPGNRHATRLPRGRFLLVAGDVGYYIADYPTIAERFQKPFGWAYDDLVANKLLSPDDVRPLIGVPGNHDYYDVLHGYSLQFRKPVGSEYAAAGVPHHDAHGYGPRLVTKGFARVQQGSYSRLSLPFDWTLWALDVPMGGLDERQAEFFAPTAGSDEPNKLIVVTHEPTTAFGAFSSPDSPLARAFARLRLPRCFLKGEPPLPEDRCRLDLAGHVHHYVRYWGESDEAGDAEARANYASVVAGGGGAFLHATHTEADSVKANRHYPDRGTSFREVTSRLLRPTTLALGGNLWLIGAVVAAYLYFAAAVPASSRSALDGLMRALGLAGVAPLAPVDGILASIRAALDVAIPDTGSPFEHPSVLVLLGILAGLVVAAGIRARAKPIIGRDRWWLGYVVSQVAVLAVLVAGVVELVPGAPAPALHPFFASLAVLLSVLGGGAALVMSRAHSDIVVARTGHRNPTRLDTLPGWGYLVVGVLLPICGTWQFGTYPAAVLMTDMLTLIVLLIVLLGVPAMSFAANDAWVSVWKRLLIGGLAIVLVLVLMVVPVAYVAYRDTALVSLLALGVVGAVSIAAQVLIRRGWRVAPDLSNQRQLALTMLAVWLALGLILVGPAYVYAQSAPVPADLYRLLAAAALGALLVCLWLGWYLAVGLSFGGLNNDASAAARIEGYKQFLRVRLRRNDLTGFVIAVDQPATELGALSYRVVDEFRIRCGK